MGAHHRHSRLGARVVNRSPSISRAHRYAQISILGLAGFCPPCLAAESVNLNALAIKWGPLLLKGFALDVLISVCAMLLGTLLGVLLGIGQIARPRALRSAAHFITQFFRNAPWLVLLFFCVLLLPYEIHVAGFSIPLPGWAKGIVGLALPVMGNVSEVVRGGIQSVASGQWEAAESLAMNRRKVLFIIIFPQALKRMLPPWMNVYATLMMATPLVSIVGVEESLAMAQAILSAERDPGLLMPIYGVLLLMFFAYCAPIAYCTRRLEKRFASRQ